MYFVSDIMTTCFIVTSFAIFANAGNYEAPSATYGTPAPAPAKPLTSYEVPIEVASAAPAIEYEIVAPEVKYELPTQPKTTYGPPPKPEPKYGPPQPKTTYGPPPKPEPKYEPPQPKTTYGPPPKPEPKYGPPQRVEIRPAPTVFSYRPLHVIVRKPVLRYTLHFNPIETIRIPSRSYGVPVAPYTQYGVPSFY
ncbi:hypothetical protein FQA39_LY11330 [Lamprigera yunnana]|nr:hypothetical protein FQA39_LY11330 [Lamprigera yunnana]